jgi:hypothetical protein
MSLPLPLFLRLNHSYQICGYCLRSPSTKTLPEGVLGFDGGDGGGIRIIAQPHPTASERRWILSACLRSDRFDSIRFNFARSSEEKPPCGRAVGWLAGWLAGWLSSTVVVVVVVAVAAGLNPKLLPQFPSSRDNLWNFRVEFHFLAKCEVEESVFKICHWA